MADNIPIDDDVEEEDAPENSGGASGKPLVYQPPVYEADTPAAPPNDLPTDPHAPNYHDLSSQDFTYNDKSAVEQSLAVPKKLSRGGRLNELKNEVVGFFGLNKDGRAKWHDFLSAHASKNVDLNLHPEFGERLAKTLQQLRDMGFNFEIISGVRSHEKQEALYKGYGIYDDHGKRVGETHVVAQPGQSSHEEHGLEKQGCAVDVNPIGCDKVAFYQALYAVGEKNGLEFVRDKKTGRVIDENHVQIANAHEFINQLRTEEKSQSSTQVAMSHPPARNGVQPPS